MISLRGGGFEKDKRNRTSLDEDLERVEFYVYHTEEFVSIAAQIFTKFQPTLCAISRSFLLLFIQLNIMIEKNLLRTMFDHRCSWLTEKFD